MAETADAMFNIARLLVAKNDAAAAAARGRRQRRAPAPPDASPPPKVGRETKQKGAPANVVAAVRPGRLVYTAQAGETLWAVAKRGGGG